MRFATASLAFLVLSLSHVGDGAEGPALPIVTKVEQQPLVSQVERLVESLDMLGAPLSKPDREALKAAMIDADADRAVAGIQKVLDPYCLVGVELQFGEPTDRAGRLGEEATHRARLESVSREGPQRGGIEGRVASDQSERATAGRLAGSRREESLARLARF